MGWYVEIRLKTMSLSVSAEQQCLIRLLYDEGTLLEIGAEKFLAENCPPGHAQIMGLVRFLLLVVGRGVLNGMNIVLKMGECRFVQQLPPLKNKTIKDGIMVLIREFDLVESCLNRNT